MGIKTLIVSSKFRENAIPELVGPWSAVNCNEATRLNAVNDLLKWTKRLVRELIVKKKGSKKKTILHPRI